VTLAGWLDPQHCGRRRPVRLIPSSSLVDSNSGGTFANRHGTRISVTIMYLYRPDALNLAHGTVGRNHQRHQSDGRNGWFGRGVLSPP